MECLGPHGIIPIHETMMIVWTASSALGPHGLITRSQCQHRVPHWRSWAKRYDYLYACSHVRIHSTHAGITFNMFFHMLFQFYNGVKMQYFNLYYFNYKMGLTFNISIIHWVPIICPKIGINKLIILFVG